ATKNGNGLGAEETEEIISWENTIKRIFNLNPENVLLEFTATADLSITAIEDKYSDKLIYDYSLSQFRKDGYSKEIKVLQAGLSSFDRALQAVLLSQYRRKLFEKHKILVKPVILFKSITIKESHDFFELFIKGFKNLETIELDKIEKANASPVIHCVFKYFKTHNIRFENLVEELKEDFSPDKLISVNSKDESEQKQLAVNSLEDEENPYRAIFAVDKLNEGWDVLNLFDIVRLYDTPNSRTAKAGKTTMAEAQLIGRGARYCPFQISNDQNYARRKFDNDLSHELRVCEELYYHSYYNPKYIQDLNKALVEIGIKDSQESGNISDTESTIKYTESQMDALLVSGNNIKDPVLKQLKETLVSRFKQIHKYNLEMDDHAIINSDEKKEKNTTREMEFLLTDFGDPIIRKAINKIEFYRFSNLKNIFPDLNSIDELVHSEKYLGQLKINLTGHTRQLTELLPGEKLRITINLLSEISKSL
ncbi:MAG: hypothetical protein ACSLE0_16245, partial [Chitinophagaceae bacterium]